MHISYREIANKVGGTSQTSTMLTILCCLHKCIHVRQKHRHNKYAQHSYLQVQPSRVNHGANPPILVMIDCRQVHAYIVASFHLKTASKLPSNHKKSGAMFGAPAQRRRIRYSEKYNTAYAAARDAKTPTQVQQQLHCNTPHVQMPPISNNVS